MAAWTQHSNLNDSLTERQREVLVLIAAGRTNPEIADALGVSLAGAKWHVSEVISRLGVQTREEAAEIWREEHALPRRFVVWARGIAGVGLMKAAAGGIATAAVAGMAVGAIAIVQDARRSSKDSLMVSAPIRLEFPNALYSRAQARDVGRILASAAVSDDSLLATTTFKSRQFSPSDLVPTSERFIENADWASTGLPGKADEFPTGKNIWLVEFTAAGFDSPSGPADLTVTVSFEDGDSVLIESWMDRPELPLPPAAHPDLPEFLASTFMAESRTFRILVGDKGTDWTIALRIDEVDNSWTVVGGYAVVPGSGLNSSDDMFGVSTFAPGAGYVAIFGAVSSNVVRVELLLEDGQRATVTPQLPTPGTAFPYQVFGAAFPFGAQVQEARAYDANGSEVGLFKNNVNSVNR